MQIQKNVFFQLNLKIGDLLPIDVNYVKKYDDLMMLIALVLQIKYVMQLTLLTNMARCMGDNEITNSIFYDINDNTELIHRFCNDLEDRNIYKPTNNNHRLNPCHNGIIIM